MSLSPPRLNAMIAANKALHVFLKAFLRPVIGSGQADEDINPKDLTDLPMRPRIVYFDKQTQNITRKKHGTDKHEFLTAQSGAIISTTVHRDEFEILNPNLFEVKNAKSFGSEADK